MSDELRSNLDRAKDDLASKVQALVKANEKSEKQEEVNSESVSHSDTSESASEEYIPKDHWEEQALAIGWKPDHSGKTFIDAKEYVLRKPLFERIDRQGSELRELKNMNQQIASHLSSLRKEAYEQALKDLESKRIQAINEGDSSQVFTTERQIKEIEIRKSNDPIVRQPEYAPIQEKHPDVGSFEQRNASWYNVNTPENRRMVEAAGLIDKQLAEEAHERGIVLDPKEHLRTIEERIRKNFSHRFENPKKEAPIMVGRSSTSKELSKTDSLVARLSAEQRNMGEYFVRSTKTASESNKMTLEKYAAELEKLGRLK